MSWQKIARRIRVPLGFAFAAIYLWLARPTLPFLAAGAVLAAAGLLIRALASGHVRKNEVLTTTGPYAYTRNPLYLGSILLGVGFALAARSGWIAALLVCFFLAIYVPVIHSEEAFLRRRFPEFEDYARRVPRLIPRLRAPQGFTQGFSRDLYWKHREYNAALGTLLMLAALVLKMILFPK
jgi:protein-S-isoprenylcysteine O-methyltransferase Ste14